MKVARGSIIKQISLIVILCSLLSLHQASNLLVWRMAHAKNRKAVRTGKLSFLFDADECS